MREFQQRRSWKKFFRSRYMIAILAILVILVGHGVWNAYGRYERSKEALEMLEREYTQLSDRKERALSATLALSSDDGLERELRSTYGLVREGENLIVIVDPRGDDADDTAVVESTWWEKLLSVFGF